MKNKIFFFVLLNIFLISQTFACGNCSAHNHSEKSSKSDGQIEKLIITLDKNEIGAAKVVLTHKNINTKVQDFANLMVKEHSKNLKDAMNVSQTSSIQPQSSSIIINLQKQGAAELNKLKSLTGDQCQKTYINFMVTDHTNALKLIDESLNIVKNLQLKNLLTDTRKHVSHHLEIAKSIQAGL